jgi:hypothetical protein
MIFTTCTIASDITVPMVGRRFGVVLSWQYADVDVETEQELAFETTSR